MDDHHAHGRSRRVTAVLRAGAPPRPRTLLVATASLLAASFLLGVAGCRSAGDVLGLLEEDSPRERYTESLRDAGLAGTALGDDWLAAGKRALREPHEVTTPYREEGYLPPEEPEAVAWRVSVPRGRRLVAEVRMDAGRPLRLFLDLFVVEQGPDSTTFRRVVSADSGSTRLEVEADQDRTFLLRLQPELLRGGRYHLRLQQEATLAFPVTGVGAQAVKSGFGAPREAGRRTHQGVDIFAPRGTPAVAAAPGRARVGTNRLGGRVVWLRAEGIGASLYYAHLDSQTVSDGQRVARGDTVGLVGNTGNARTTPPHLHFAVYRRGEGPVDPLPFIHVPPGEAPPPGAAGALLGRLARTPGRANLRGGAALDAPRLVTLDRHTPLVPRALTAGWFRVELPDGRTGHVFGELVTPAEDALGTVVIEDPTGLTAEPREGSVEMTRLAPGDSLALLGRFEGHLLVRSSGDLRGWIDDRGLRSTAGLPDPARSLALGALSRLPSSRPEPTRSAARSTRNRP